MKALYKLSIASFKQFYRDKTALFFTFAFPLLFMVIFGLVFSGGEDVVYDIGMVNRDNSEAGTFVTQTLKEMPIFTVTEGELDQELGQLRDGERRAVVLIPPDLSATIGQGQTADITVYYDPAQTNSSQVILSVLGELINQVNRQITQEPVLIQLAEESIQIKDLRIIDVMVPGILAMAVLFLGLFGSLSMVEWREKQVLKRFGATPLRRSTLVLAQVLYRLILSLVQTFIIILVARFAFNVPMVGNWLLLLGMVLLGALTFISLGYLAVARARSVEGAMPIIQLIQLPMLFLSGIFFPLDFMPDFMRPIVTAMPLTYLGDAFRQIMVDATPFYPMTIDIAVLGGWLVVCMALTIWLFKWE